MSTPLHARVTMPAPDEINELCVLLADMIEAGAHADKVDVLVVRYSDDGNVLLQFEDGTEFEVTLTRTR